MRAPPALLLSLLLALPLALEDPAPLAGQDLQRPADWEVRFDQPTATEADLIQFVEMPPGWHITTGPAGIFWDPAQDASGRFRVELEVFLFDPGSRREAFGIFFGGEDLHAPDQSYTYFLIRNGGQFILKAREGAEAPTLQGWTGHEAIRSFDERKNGESSVLNELAVEADTETVRFYVNGAEVASLPRGEIQVEGQVGVRVNHGLNLHLARLEVTPLR